MTLFGEPAKIIPRIFQHFYLRAIFTADWWWNTLKWLGYRVHLFYYVLTLGILKRPLGRLACKTVKNQPTMHGIHNKLLKLILKPQMRPFFVWKEIYYYQHHEAASKQRSKRAPRIWAKKTKIPDPARNHFSAFNIFQYFSCGARGIHSGWLTGSLA